MIHSKIAPDMLKPVNLNTKTKQKELNNNDNNIDNCTQTIEPNQTEHCSVCVFVFNLCFVGRKIEVCNKQANTKFCATEIPLMKCPRITIKCLQM